MFRKSRKGFSIADFDKSEVSFSCQCVSDCANEIWWCRSKPTPHRYPCICLQSRVLWLPLSLSWSRDWPSDIRSQLLGCWVTWHRFSTLGNTTIFVKIEFYNSVVRNIKIAFTAGDTDISDLAWCSIHIVSGSCRCSHLHCSARSDSECKCTCGCSWSLPSNHPTCTGRENLLSTSRTGSVRACQLKQERESTWPHLHTSFFCFVLNTKHSLSPGHWTGMCSDFV